MPQTKFNSHLTGECVNRLAGVVEQTKLVEVGGLHSYRYRRYLASIGMVWSAREKVWVGYLSPGRIWFLRTRLQLCVDTASEHTPIPAPTPIRVGFPCENRRTERSAKWEYYSAVPVNTNRSAQIDPNASILTRRCFWGCDLCQTCLQCVANRPDDDEYYYVPEMDDSDVREHAVLPVPADDQLL